MNGPDRHSFGAGIRGDGDTAELADDPLSRYQPDHLTTVGREPSLVRLLTSEEVHFAESPIAGVVDDGGEQDGRRIPPAGIGMPSALIEAHASGHLECHHGGDDGVFAHELVDDHFVNHRTPGASGDEAIEGREEIGAVAPLQMVEDAQGVEAGDDAGTADGPLRHPFSSEAVGGATKVPTELRRRASSW